ncbi:MAG: CoA transferase [Phycisphaerales bacterium]|nr:CoA transferase [Phycisphaerales bacterium]
MTEQPATNLDPARPLEGVIIVDLSRVLAGPFCTLILAQLGARVIKVEAQSQGDDARGFGPYVNGKSLYFSSVNHQKESIALDLKSAQGRIILDALLDRADVLVENFRPGALTRLGYSWETLRARWPRLVYAQVSGFGATGPKSGRAAYDIVAQAMGGIMSVTGHEGDEPVRVGVSMADMVAGMYTVIGILAAMVKRQRTGAGSHVDVSMLDCQVAMLEAELTSFLTANRQPRRLGSRHPNIAPFQAFRTQDSHVVIAAGNDALFGKLCAACSLATLSSDARFASNSLRVENVEALQQVIEGALAEQTTEFWLTQLESAGVPAAPVNTAREVVADPQVQARNMIRQISDPQIGKLFVAGSPIKFAGVPDPVALKAPPALDEDRDAILRWAGVAETVVQKVRN